jgi:hypothetical protein
LPRGHYSKRRLRRIIPVLWSAWARLHKAGAADRRMPAPKAYYEKAAALGNEDAKAALKRAQCPYVIKDKRGNVVTPLCF